jgi:acylphosphatase
MAAIRIVVTGRVQGVGFRYFVLQAAQGLGIDGEVWNRLDRKVEIIAEHPDRAVLDELVSQVWEGPGYVDDVHVEPAAGGYIGFEVGRTR